MIVGNIPILNTIVEETVHTIVEESVIDVLLALSITATKLEPAEHERWRHRLIDRRVEIERHKTEILK